MDEKFKNSKLPKALELELRKAYNRPSWESSNEGVHERVTFDDTIWGFNLAGGAYYKTPLRITQVKEGSRADHAGMKVGDLLVRINDIDSSTLSIQEAHDIILESGIQIKLALTAPDVEETTRYVYEDQVEEELREIRRRQASEKQKKAKKFNGAKTNEAWSVAWPCSKKRDVMYKESNCFLVPSHYETKHPDKIKSNVKSSKSVFIA
ncbi:PDZ domain-containing protein 7-like [Hyposmocoma kahamanoa]|uniref:PDZ domain-containing protein 7-like n=1 Tax=Hyposmocoma kahamanoa TaxID=1477025 RepID=UPI000E6D789E|nr:PDZ domain-containing protein 7-like [Hyposmocoma kahamanoa]